MEGTEIEKKVAPPPPQPPPSPHREGGGSSLLLFAEEDEALACVASLTAHHHHHHHDDDDDDVTRAAAAVGLDRLGRILDKYLECPTLLDASLETLVRTLAEQVLTADDDDDDTAAAAAASSRRADVPRYPLSALYRLTKVRGVKTVTRFLPHGVSHVHVVWRTMRRLQRRRRRDECESLDSSDRRRRCPPPPLWESLYVLRHWLGALSLVPFDGAVFEEEHDEDGFAVVTLLDACRVELDEAGPLREAAATCLAAWLSRPDVVERNHHLPAFVAWCREVIDEAISSSSSSSRSCCNIFRLLGVCRTLGHLLKRSSVARTHLVRLLQPTLWDPLWTLADAPVAVQHNLLLRRLLNKWWTRMSCAHLPPRGAPPWRYQRGRRSLWQEIDVKSGTDPTSPGNVPSETIPPANENDKDPVDDLFEVPDLVEDAMGRLLEALGHSSTVVRWSAAKGIGRITERLPAICAQDVLDALLEMFDNYERDQAWHGACLTLAELARRGLLLPHRLGDVLPHVVTAVHYDLRRGGNNGGSVGAHVRDAACFVFWAFARAYAPAVLKRHLQPLAEAVVLISLFDREVNCRRAASAAFQEAVGRQGATSFPNGIAIITAADFFSLGNRKEAYTTIAMKVARFEEYRGPILKHLYKDRLFHWDVTVRKLSAQALAQLSAYDPEFLGRVAMPFLLEKSLDSSSVIIRHGAVLAVAELTKAFAEQSVLTTVLSDQIKASLVAVVGEIDRRRLYRGRGGEMMRSACCRLVECISLSQLTLTVKEQVKMLDTVDASIPHPSEEIQECACKALGQLLSACFPVGEMGPSDRLQTRVVDKFLKQLKTNQNVAATRGYALALGFLPAKLLAPSADVISKIFVALRETARPDAKVGNEGDAETRRNALFSFARIVNTLRDAVGPAQKYPIIPLNEKHINGILSVYMNGLKDYNTDRRGDVGSWCRLAAMSGLVALMTTDRPEDTLVDWCSNPTVPTEVVGGFLKQLGEKLDTVRRHAEKCLGTVLVDKSLAVHRKAQVRDILGLDDTDRSQSHRPSGFDDLLRVSVLEADPEYPKSHVGSEPKPYFFNVIAGIAVSSGGLTTSTSNDATGALIRFAKQRKESPTLDDLGDSYLRLLREHRSENRVIVPVMKSLEALLLHQCFDSLIRRPRREFATAICECLEQETRLAGDIKRLMLMADVAVALVRAMPTGDNDGHRVTGLLCSLLHSPYPRLRSHVSQHLYLALHDVPHVVSAGNDSDVMDAIIETPWGTEMDRENVEKCVVGIAEKLGVKQHMKLRSE